MIFIEENKTGSFYGPIDVSWANRRVGRPRPSGDRGQTGDDFLRQVHCVFRSNNCP